MMGEIKAICISERRGTAKYEIEEAEIIEDYGIKGDAHAGKWHRQISILSYDSVELFKRKAAFVRNGGFGENILVEGYDLKNFPIGTHFRCGNVLLELTQIGKKCHTQCEISKEAGMCIMPTEGIFTKVLKGGMIRKGDIMIVEK